MLYALKLITSCLTQASTRLSCTSSPRPHRYANTVSEQNTSRAIEAAATGKIPTSYATKYGSANAKAAASWGECWNCNVWN